MARPLTCRNEVRQRRGLPAGFLMSLACLLGSTAGALAQPVADSVTILVYDASGSMCGQLPGGATKLAVARKVLGDSFLTREAAILLVVIVDGHDRRGHCSVIEVAVQVVVHDANPLSARSTRISPVGTPPLTDALEHAARPMSAPAEPADIVL